MTLDELRVLLANYLDEDGVYRTDAQLNAALGDAYRIVALATQGCEVTTSFTVNANSRFTGLPNDFFVPVSVLFEGTRLYPVRISDLDALNPSWIDATTSTPTYYFVTGAMSSYPLLWLYPPVGSASRMRLTYASVPADMENDTDTPRLPLEYHKLISGTAYGLELLREFMPLLVNKAFQVLSDCLVDINRLRAYVYRRTPDRDWELPPWDIEALRLKVKGFDLPQPQQQQREMADLGS